MRPRGLIHIVRCIAGALLRGHVEDRGCLAWVIDDDIVDVVVVDYVRDIWTSSSLLLLCTLVLARWWATAAHPEALAVRVSLALEPAIILALFCH